MQQFLRRPTGILSYVQCTQNNYIFLLLPLTFIHLTSILPHGFSEMSDQVSVWLSRHIFSVLHCYNLPDLLHWLSLILLVLQYKNNLLEPAALGQHLSFSSLTAIWTWFHLITTIPIVDKDKSFYKRGNFFF